MYDRSIVRNKRPADEAVVVEADGFTFKKGKKSKKGASASQTSSKGAEQETPKRSAAAMPVANASPAAVKSPAVKSPKEMKSPKGKGKQRASIVNSNDAEINAILSSIDRSMPVPLRPVKMLEACLQSEISATSDASMKQWGTLLKTMTTCILQQAESGAMQVKTKSKQQASQAQESALRTREEELGVLIQQMKDERTALQQELQVLKHSEATAKSPSRRKSSTSSVAIMPVADKTFLEGSRAGLLHSVFDNSVTTIPVAAEQLKLVSHQMKSFTDASKWYLSAASEAVQQHVLPQHQQGSNPASLIRDIAS